MNDVRDTLGSFRRVYIDRQEDLRPVVADVDGYPEIAVDLEMVQRIDRKPGGIQEWRHVLALIQLAAGQLSVVIDPLRCRDLSPLRPLMAGSSRKVFLGGGQDASLLERSNIPARNIVDVGEVALALFGRREDGMAALAYRIFGISLDKTVRRADWTARPLNPVLVSYAHRDAELTLLIYRWFRDQHPDVLHFHERRDFEPSVSPGSPEWLTELIKRSGQDPRATLMEAGMELETHEEIVSAGLRTALAESRAPRLTNRLIRIVADLHLQQLVHEVAPLLHSPSSMLRASAARTIGQISDGDPGIALLQPLLEDPIEDVRNAVHAALSELRSPSPDLLPEASGTDAPSLDGEALSALARFKLELDLRDD